MWATSTTNKKPMETARKFPREFYKIINNLLDILEKRKKFEQSQPVIQLKVAVGQTSRAVNSK